jgi:hypothetical protein
MYAGDPVVRWDSYDTVTDSAGCSDDHHHHDVSSSAGSTQSEYERLPLFFQIKNFHLSQESR